MQLPTHYDTPNPHTGGQVPGDDGYMWDLVTADCQCLTCVAVREDCTPDELATLPRDTPPAASPMLARVSIAQYGLHCAMSLSQDAEGTYRTHYHFIDGGMLTHTEVFSVKAGPFAADLAASFWCNHLDAIQRWAVVTPSEVAA